MRNTLRSCALLALVLVAVPLVAMPALAQYREFSGLINKVKKGKKGKLIVDNRMGDKVSFVRVDSTEVSGEGKSKWDDLRKGDYVTVSWKMMDKPRKAYKVEVKPTPKEAGEDE